MSFEVFMQAAFTVTIVTSLTWAWWHSRRTPEEEAEIAMLDAGLLRHRKAS